MTRWPAFASRGFRLLILVRAAITMGINAQTVMVGWQLYELTRNPLHLGLIGLVQFAPAVLLVLVTGAAADRFRRPLVVAVGLAVLAVCALCLHGLLVGRVATVWPYYLVLLAAGIGRAFLMPAMQAMLPDLVPREHLANAVALNAMVSRIGASVGPLVGGALLAADPNLAYGFLTSTFLFGMVTALRISSPRRHATGEPPSVATLFAGLFYIRSNRLLAGAISLDLYVMLMGGAAALLPVFAQDILAAGPEGLGVLRGAPAAGGLCAALHLSLVPMRSRAGPVLFASAALFGLSVAAFGLSTIFWLSVIVLFVMGAAEMVSVNVRWTLVQLATPADKRGRVSAVASVSATGSTELGDFRAGLVASLIGPEIAVISGGVLTMLGAFAWMRWFPELWRVGDFSRISADDLHRP